MGANGAYVDGFIYLTAGQELYVYVGAPGKDAATGTGAGYNGGGNPGHKGRSGSGGGATSISTVSGLWNDSNVLNNRIAVAAGGGGGGNYSNGGAGGDLNGVNGGGGRGGTQTRGYQGGKFGIGGTPSPDGGGGGGGWYGGGAGNKDNGGGGGSSYLNGYNGCELRNTSLVFTQGKLINGNSVMPTPSGGWETGHSGQCYAYIRLVQ